MPCTSPQTSPCSRALLGLLLLASGLCVGLTAQAKPAQCSIDPVHSRIAFQVDHAGFSLAIGTLSGIRGQLSFDADDWSTAKVEATIPLATLDLGERDWNAKILGRAFLDADQFPQARFVSTRVTQLDPSRLRIEGELELHGQRQAVTLEARVNAIKRHPLTLRRTAGFSATATLSRKAFGVDAWPSLVGDEVVLRIEIEATRQGQAEGNAGEEKGGKDDDADTQPR